MKKTALILIIITLLSKVVGFVRDIVLSYFYGASAVTDVYVIATTLTGIVFSFVSAAIATSFIPMYSNISKKNGDEEANRFTSNLMNSVFILTSVIIVLSLIFTEPLVRLLASGFEGETLSIAINFVRISIFVILFMAANSFFAPYLQLKGNFIIPASMGFISNFVVIASFVLSSLYSNEYILAYGIVCGGLAQVLFMYPWVRKNNFIFSFKLDFKDKNIQKFILLTVPVILGIAVNQINLIVDRTIASGLYEGAISELNYASRLNGFVNGLIISSITVVIYPMISKFVSENDQNELKKSVKEAIGMISLIVIPATVGFMVFSKEIVNMLFGRGAFDELAVTGTAYALFFYSIGMIGLNFREILSRIFYAYQDTRTPMVNASIGLVLNIILNLILSKYMGIGGLALATSVSAIVTTLLLVISLKKKAGSFGFRSMVLDFIKIGIASIIMGLISKLGYISLNNNFSSTISLLLSIIFAAIVYFIIIIFMKIEEVEIIKGLIKSKIFKKN